jgi:hypothetical protein
MADWIVYRRIQDAAETGVQRTTVARLQGYQALRTWKDVESIMKMKRVLITVGMNSKGFRYGLQMQEAVGQLLANGLRSDLWSANEHCQKILDKDGKVVAKLSSCDWLPDDFGRCPPQFVLNLPAHMWRDGVPEYKGKIRREAIWAMTTTTWAIFGVKSRKSAKQSARRIEQHRQSFLSKPVLRLNRRTTARIWLLKRTAEQLIFGLGLGNGRRAAIGFTWQGAA